MNIDVKHENLKLRIEDCYNLIKFYEEEILKIRKECEHPNKETVDYYWGPGKIAPGTVICSVCNKVLIL